MGEAAGGEEGEGREEHRRPDEERRARWVAREGQREQARQGQRASREAARYDEGEGQEDVGGGGAGIVRRGKPSTTLALKATQVSTASLGKFDRLREGEPERKGQLSKNVAGKKRKQPLDAGADGGGGGGTNGKFLQSEAKRCADILSRVMNGGPSSKERERDVKRGKYAKGETAYDYEYDDGLGGGSFRKKKVSWLCARVGVGGVS